MRLSWILGLSLLTPLLAQTPPAKGAETPAPGATDAAAKKASPLVLLRAADEADRGPALVRFVDAQIATNAVYSGQYAELGKLGWDTMPMLRAWMVKAPPEAKADAAQFRDACINAVRDCVEKASDELLAELETLATAAETPDRVATSAKYALAQFGKTEHVDAMIEAATERTAATDIQTKVDAWSQLADIYYNIRRFEDAAKAHGKVIAAIEAVNPQFRGLPTAYYNCACSYALMGNKEAAFEHLTKALQVGKRVRQQLGLALLETDMDIRSLRPDPAFAALMKEYFGIEPPKADPGAEPAKKEPGKKEPGKQ